MDSSFECGVGGCLTLWNCNLVTGLSVFLSICSDIRTIFAPEESPPSCCDAVSSSGLPSAVTTGVALGVAGEELRTSLVAGEPALAIRGDGVGFRSADAATKTPPESTVAALVLNGVVSISFLSCAQLVGFATACWSTVGGL